MAFREQDAGIFVSDFSVTARLADGTEFPVVLDYPEDAEMFTGQSQMGQVAGKPQIAYVTAAVPTLKSEDAIVVDGQAYKVRFAKQLDELHSVALLKKVSA
jgi:hypothetical protein